MLREIRELGFDYAELSHGIRISLLPGILDAVDAGEIRISSLHNFCPLPMGVDHPAPNLFKFTADNPRERENAFKHTLKTLETAVRVKAPLVVLHLGSIEMKDYTEKLLGLVGEGKKETPKYEKLCEEVVFRREEKKEVVYWHDTGHAQIKANLGFIHHAMHLESLRDRLHGFHIHDVQFPGRDHRAPGTGMIDFAALARLVKPQHLKVFEFSPSLSPEDAKQGVAHLQALWGHE